MTLATHRRRDCYGRAREAFAARMLACSFAWLLVAGGCAGTSERGSSTPSPTGDGACVVVPAGDRGAENRSDLDQRPIVVALPGPADPHTLIPRTPAERFLFAHLYETLVGIDCDGRVVPALATSWFVEEDGRRWTFRLRADARDRRDEAVTARTVATSWLRVQEAGRSGAGQGTVGDEAPSPAITQITVDDAGTLRVQLARSVGVEHFAQPALSVRTGLDRHGWPTGSGPYGIASEPEDPTDPGRASPAVRLTGPSELELRPVSGDVRDALDAGVDLLVTSDPAVIDYARRLAGLTTAPLAWDRTYLLASGAAAPARESDPVEARDRPSRPTVIRAPPAALEGLARDAVRAEARPAFMPEESGTCLAEEPTGRRPPETGPQDARIVYLAGDPIARSLAERLVALALDPSSREASWLAATLPDPAAGGQSLRAAGLSEAAFAGALRSGRDAAYVLSVGGRGCTAVTAAVRAAPWLEPGSTEPAGDRIPAAVPLIETRSTLVVRRGIGGVGVDGLGTLRLDGLQ